MNTNLSVKTRIGTKALLAFILELNTLFMFMNPDKWLGISQYFYFIVAFCLIAMITGLNKNNVTTQYTRDALIMLVGCLFYILYSLITGVYQRGYILSYALYTTFLFFSTRLVFEAKHIKAIINSYMFSGAIIAALLIVKPQTYYLAARNTIQIGNNPAFDPNMLSAYLVVPTLIALAKTIKRRKIWLFIMLGIISLGLLMTASRGAMVSVALGAIVILFGYLKEKGQASKKIQIMMVIAVGLIIVGGIIPPETYNRLFESSYNDTSNAIRWLNWKAGLEAILKKPLFGYGMQDETAIINMSINVERRAHNTYLAFLLQFGLIGIIPLINWVVHMYRGIKGDYVLKAFLFSTLCVILFISAEVNMFLWIPLVYVCMISNYEKQSDKNYEWL